MLAELEAATGRKVQRCAKTHSVAAKIGGCTLDSFLRRAIVKGAALPQTLWVDEFSLIDSSSWCLLNFLLFAPTPVQIILSGDWAQLPGIGSCYKGAPLANGRVEQSQLLHQLCGGARLTMTVCRRSDACRTRPTSGSSSAHCLKVGVEAAVRTSGLAPCWGAVGCWAEGASGRVS